MQFRKYHALILCILSVISRSRASEVKQNTLNTLTKEITLFQEAIKAGKKCIRTKQCSPKERKMLTKATGHGIALLALLAGTGALLYRTTHRTKGISENLFGDILNAISKQNKSLEAVLPLYAKDMTSAQRNALLIIAIHFGTPTIVDQLLQAGASVAYIDGKNTSILQHFAARAGGGSKDEKIYQTKIMNILFDALRKLPNKNAIVNHQGGPYHSTALMVAAQEHNTDLVRKLLEIGANKSLQDKDSETAYDYAQHAPSAPQELLDLLHLPK